MGYILAFLAIGAMIFVHEFGHFIIAKLCKIPVHVFSIGFGPSLFEKKVGETKYCLKLLPLGGFVSLEGENDKNSDKGFLNQKWYKRLAVLSAGIIFNVLFAILLFSLIFSFYGVPSRGIYIQYVAPDTYAEEFLQPQDMIVKINDHYVTENDAENLKLWIKEGETEPLDVTVKRGTETFGYKIPLSEIEGRKLLGISYSPSLEFIDGKATLSDVFVKPVQEGIDTIKLIFTGFTMIAEGEVSSDDVYGPIGIIKTTNDIANNSFPLFLYWVAVLSINLAVMNALPIPALDGGHIMLLIWECIVTKLFGKHKWNLETVNKINTAFLFLLLGLMVYITLGDIVTFFFQ